MNILRVIPLMGVVLGAYNLVAMLNPDPTVSVWLKPSLQLQLPSTAAVTLTLGHVFICVTLLVMFFELVKSATASNAAMVEQSLSTLVFVGFLLEFLLYSGAAEATFFVLMLISFVRVMAGFIILVKVARRDIQVH